MANSELNIGTIPIIEKVFICAYIDDIGVHAWTPCGEAWLPSDASIVGINIVTTLVEGTLENLQISNGVSFCMEVNETNDNVLDSMTVNCSTETFALLDEDDKILTDENNVELWY